MSHNSTERFSKRAEQYRLFRPAYPREILSFLKEKIALDPSFKIADIGSGTGIFSKLFLEESFPVYAVEPNAKMRLQAEDTLSSYANFHSIAGTAENTNLPDHEFNLVTVAQAFHWFDPEKTRQEFQRIATSNGHILLLWNIIESHTPFLKAYTQLKDTYSHTIVHPYRANLQKIKEIFHPLDVVYHTLNQKQSLDKQGLKGHLESFSTTFDEHDELYSQMIDELHDIFQQYNKNGLVEIEYQTRLYLISLHQS